MTAGVTVVIPVYNGGRFLGSTIESLLDQSRPAASIICVDDASTDDSRRIAVAYAARGVSLVVNENTRGLAANWNRAVNQVRTPFFVIAHQDDVYEREYLADMVPLIESRARAFMAHCKTISIDAAGNRADTPAARYKETLWPREDPYEHAIEEELPRLARGNFIVCPAVIFRTEAVKEIGAFDTRFRFVTDWEYWVRGLARGYTIAGTHRRLVRFRRHSGTATRSSEQNFDRYREEAAMAAIIRETAERAAVRLPRSPGPLPRILLSEFSTLLDQGDRDRAARLLLFADDEIPRFRGSAASRIMHVMGALGRPGGRLLKGMERLALSVGTRGLRS